MEKKIESKKDETTDKKLNISDVIERLSKLEKYYIYAKVDEFGEDGELVVTETDRGDWIDAHELDNLINEFKNAL